MTEGGEGETKQINTEQEVTSKGVMKGQEGDEEEKNPTHNNPGASSGMAKKQPRKAKPPKFKNKIARGSAEAEQAIEELIETGEL